MLDEDKAASGPLDGIRVLDLTRYVSGPHATQMMGDSGADVVKVEGFAGDGMRMADSRLGQPDSMLFMTISRAKRSLSIDLRKDAGKAVLRDLVQQADILVENFRPGVLEKMGFGWDVLQEINPRLILVRISGFGQDGPWAERASYDPVIQALSGIQSLTGKADDSPTVCGTVVTDYLAGLHAVIGAVCVYVGGYQIGYGPVTWTYIAEIFPLQPRGSALALAVFVNFSLNAIVLFVSAPLLDLSVSVTFAVFFAIGLYGLYFAQMNVPETKGLELEQITDMLHDLGTKREAALGDVPNPLAQGGAPEV